MAGNCCVVSAVPVEQIAQQTETAENEEAFDSFKREQFTSQSKGTP
jgi:hypothetical protein